MRLNPRPWGLTITMVTNHLLNWDDPPSIWVSQIGIGCWLRLLFQISTMIEAANLRGFPSAADVCRFHGHLLKQPKQFHETGA